ncbi:peroxiredoxin family protein [Frigoriflavimonas asaccharolytica]|uniref:Thioredoxin-related protein n=1 Tax=Frigoriflavimonas asaccharolytica TaxID=2735899 RepID=A0A8J8GBW9_9FLAO|nr:redoxin domain-containing protein [Frigoriflavimonas asaccharolytica]NRS93374.1 thioredoxin-related protein [Frigoriflavimonas asaccharolytica]
MKNFLTVFTILICNLIFAQNGYKITVKTNGTTDDLLYLKLYNGTYSSNNIIDSARIDSNNKTVTFNQTKKIIGSIYRLELKSNPKIKADIIIENNSKPIFTLEGNSLFALSTENQLNKDFLAYQKMSGSNDPKLAALQSLQKKSPNSALNLFTILEQKRLMKIPEDLSAKVLVRNEFFNGIDLNDKQIKLMPNFFQVLYRYITILPVDNDNYKENVDILLKGQNCESKNFIFYLGWIFKNLEYFSQNNMNESFNYVFNKYLNDEKCIKTNKIFYDQNLLRLNSLEAVQIGSIIPQIEMQAFEDKNYLLSNIYSKSKYTFMMFFDPDCSHCNEQAPKVVKYFDELKLKGIDVQTISFLNTPNEIDWQKFTNEYMRSGWINVKNKNSKTDYQAKLQTYSNPNFFLLDQNGKILLKIFSEQHINNIISDKAKE